MLKRQKREICAFLIGTRNGTERSNFFGTEQNAAKFLESELESELLSAGGGGSTGGGGSAMSSVLVSPLFPLSIKVLRGNGDPVIRVGLLLLVFAETGVVLSDIQNGCITCKVAVSGFGI